MPVWKQILSYAILLGTTVSAHAAETAIRPGLWEISASSNLLSLVEQVPPDQRRQLGNIAKQYGFVMPDIRDGAATSRICVTPEMSAGNVLPNAYHRQSGCEARNARRDGNKYTADLYCEGDQVKGQGWTQATLTDAEHFTGKSAFKGLVHGVTVDEQANTSGRWIGTQCSASMAR
ncbi:DUF3617 domain-containing protein [uncultured Oxalicibacterium sp.]|uniref:DUF3617 domain-containing protein n=1 Tax=uncultured Oxalicibacterium sp. TaxID=1168540 RepID=UPI0025F4B349|nr:DUF3617 domain-containing protein [uncultured Oxalicibacterium sp.]